MKSKIKLVLIDDHQIIVEALAQSLLLNEEIDSINVFNEIDVYLRQHSAIKPDVIVTDIMMPKKSGLDFLIDLRKTDKHTRVIFLTSVVEVQTIKHAIRNGANGFLSKDATIQELLNAIISVHGGEQYIGQSLQKLLLNNAFVEDQVVYHLTAREKEVLGHVCSGKTIKETAYDMELSVNTVQTYYKNILRKFKVNRTADLIVFAMQNGLYHGIKS
jgi:DNA-binding NarL/FixJ family response regulator